MCEHFHIQIMCSECKAITANGGEVIVLDDIGKASDPNADLEQEEEEEQELELEQKEEQKEEKENNRKMPALRIVFKTGQQPEPIIKQETTKTTSNSFLASGLQAQYASDFVLMG